MAKCYKTLLCVIDTFVRSDLLFVRGSALSTLYTTSFWPNLTANIKLFSERKNILTFENLIFIFLKLRIRMYNAYEK